MKPQKQTIKYAFGIILIIAVIVAGYFMLKGKTIAGGASLRNIPAISTGCRPTIGPNGVPVAPAPSIKVISPNGGEVYQAGQQIKVLWSSCNAPQGQVIGVTLEHVLANGVQAPPDSNGSPVTILAGDGINNAIPGVSNTGSAGFILPSFQTFPNGNNYRITVFWWNAQTSTGANDRSDNSFIIQ